jgi:hypothetical protein
VDDAEEESAGFHSSVDAVEAALECDGCVPSSTAVGASEVSFVASVVEGKASLLLEARAGGSLLLIG